MRILKILSQTRRDFIAIFICEHCSYQIERNGYDDLNFHKNVIPKIDCKECGKISGKDYIPLSPRYPEGYQI